MFTRARKYLYRIEILSIYACLMLAISDLARANTPEAVTIEASQRGNPYINFTDGTALRGGSVDLSARGARAAIGGATADFDGDGVPDLAVAYRTGDAGVISIRRGNVESIFPQGAETLNEPFFPETLMFEVAFAPDYVAAGDFDADGKSDLLVAKIGATNLTLHSGNGDGNFAEPRSIDLGANLTSLTVGEVNNFDNMADVAVGVSTGGESRILIFQSRYGAFAEEPEAIEVAKAVSDLAFGDLNSHPSHDLIVASGDELVLISGTVDGKMEDVASREIGYEPMSLAVGDFVGESDNEIAVLSKGGRIDILGPDFSLLSAVSVPYEGEASNGASPSFLLSAKVSTRSKADLIAGGEGNLHLVTNSGAEDLSLAASLKTSENPVAVVPMRLNKDALKDLVVLTENTLEPSVLMTAPTEIIVVSNNNGFGAGGGSNLFNAIKTANNTPGLQEIQFDLRSGTAIQIFETLPVITDPVTLNGLSQRTPNGEPLVSIRIDPDTRSAPALDIAAGSSVVRGFILNGASVGTPIRLSTRGNNFVESNFIGTNSDGTQAGGTTAAGIDILNSSENMIGGSTATARNVISGLANFNGNSHGVHIRGESGDNRVQGNYIGTTKTGLQALGNAGSGVFIGTAERGNVVGGSTAGERNIIASNAQSGVRVVPPTNSFSDVVVENNYIGTNKDGNSPLGNLGGGIRVEYNLSSNPGAMTQLVENVVSGNTGDGIFASNTATAAPQAGVSMLLVGSRASAIGNRLGTNAAGTAAMPNTGNGIRLERVNSIIERATISGNGASGIRATGAPFSNFVADNLIGTNSAGTAAIGNANRGIWIEAAAQPTTSIQATKIYDNVISGNAGDGIFATAASLASGTAPEIGAAFLVDLGRRPAGSSVPAAPAIGPAGNKIGVNAAGTAGLANTGNGINLQNVPGLIKGNIISANGISGVKVKALPSSTLATEIGENYIGTDVSGNVDLGNSSDGITFESPVTMQMQAVSNIFDNVVSGNNGDGIRVFATANRGEDVQPEESPGFFIDLAARRPGNANSPEIGPTGNKIGTNAAGNGALGNSGNGVSIAGVMTKVGGMTPADGNTIAHNGGKGVAILNGKGNLIRSNSIFSNAQLGVDLGNDGPTSNDLLDADDGANALQNFPVLTSANSGAANVQIRAAFNSKPNNVYTLVFYSTASCVGSRSLAAQEQVGTATVTTDASGNALVNASFAVSVPLGRFITSSAIDESSAAGAAGNTSEFSPCLVATGEPTPTPTPTPTATPTPTPTQNLGFEGDLNRASSGVCGPGDGNFTAADSGQFKRFIAGLDTFCLNPNEFQRADVAPRASLGDGRLNAADQQQLSNYIAGIEARQQGGGPTIPILGSSAGVMDEFERSFEGRGRAYRLLASNIDKDGSVRISIELDSKGNETAMSFTLEFDPSKLRISRVSGTNNNPDVADGADSPAGMDRTVNATEADVGRLGILVDAAEPFESGRRQVVTVSFTVVPGAKTGPTRVVFSDGVLTCSTTNQRAEALLASFDGIDLMF